MSLERFDYPTAGAPSTTFVPTRNPAFADVEETLDPGILSEQSSGAQVYRYKEGIKVRIHRRGFRREPTAKKISFEAFDDAVGGANFEFTDYAAVVHTVSFVQPNVLKFTPSAGDRWSWEVLLREEL